MAVRIGVSATAALLVIGSVGMPAATADVPAADAIDLSAPVYVRTGKGPQSVATGDFNSDGVLDLISADSQTSDLAIVFGLGGGTFREPVRLPQPVGSSPKTVVVSDFDGDRRQDLAVTLGTADVVNVLIGNGRGRFATPSSYPAGDSPGDMVARDLDDDGDADLVVANLRSDDVSVLLGDGEGGFAVEARYPVGDEPTALDVGDLNGDDVAGVVVANIVASTVSVLIGDGSGVLDLVADIPVADFPRDVILADFDGDDQLDMAVGTNDTMVDNRDTVSVFRGDGAGGFRGSRSYQVLDQVDSLTAADFNADGIVDLVVTTGYGPIFSRKGYVSVLEGTGGALAADPTTVESNSFPRMPTSPTSMGTATLTS